MACPASSVLWLGMSAFSNRASLAQPALGVFVGRHGPCGGDRKHLRGLRGRWADSLQIGDSRVMDLKQKAAEPVSKGWEVFAGYRSVCASRR